MGLGGTAAGPGAKSGSGHPRPCTRLRKKPESKLCRVRAPRLLVRAGRGLRGGAGLELAFSAVSIPGSRSRAHLANMWLPLPFPRPAHGYFYPPDGEGRVSPSDARSPPPPRPQLHRAGEMAGWRGPGGFGGSARGLNSGIQLCTRGGAGPACSPAQTPPSWSHCPFRGTHRNAVTDTNSTHSPAQAHLVTLGVIAP